MNRVLSFWMLLLAGSPLFAEDAVPLANQAYQVLKDRCARCHGVEAESGKINVLNRESLLAARGEGTAKVFLIKPGEVEQSSLLKLIEGEDAYMPLSGSAEAGSITPAEKQLLRDWVKAGAPFPTRRGIEFVDDLTMLTAIRNHLFQADPRDRAHFRYFTLAHLYNNDSFSELNLRILKAGLSKLINSLSQERNLVLPQALPGTHDTVFYVDLRKLGWNRDRLWLKLLKRYPYAISYQSSANEELRRAAADVASLSNNTFGELVHIRADWFLANASIPPLYDEFLNSPATLSELQKRLGADFMDGFQNGTLQRSGFTHSGVSKQNRLVERMVPRHAEYLWVSYDFKAGHARGDLIRFPLGPEFTGNTYAKHAFRHDGGEVIYSLPNKLQGYLLIKANGDRLDTPAPIEIVVDKAGVSGSPQIVNGLSCMHCHRVGIISGFKDEIRHADVLGGAAADHVKMLYTSSEQMDESIRQDTEHFVTALEKVTAPFLRMGDDADKSIRSFPEPVGYSVFRFHQDLTATEAALELGLPDAATLQARIRENRALLRMGLGTLLQAPNGRIKREKWESVDGTSLFQDVAAELRIGSFLQF